jgi:hypothetical protein
MTIKIFPLVGGFAENKDIARDVRQTQINPFLKDNEDVVLDFENVESTTQSFIHALISEVIREYGIEVLDRISFKNCTETVQKIIGIVVDYMQES